MLARLGISVVTLNVVRHSNVRVSVKVVQGKWHVFCNESLKDGIGGTLQLI